MRHETFRALVAEEASPGQFRRQVEECRLADLPSHDVLVRVAHSSLNYKDALSATGHRGVTRHYPHTPGIDAAGTVVASEAADVRVGEEVVVTGFDLGMDTPGGFGQYIRVPAEWIVRRPAGLTLHETMRLGTAGLTAGLAVRELTARIDPGQGPILVTGATGGVGSVTVGLLCKLGYQVVAASGKADAAAHLHRLGDPAVVGREEVLADPQKPLLRPRWAGVVDTVGGDLLASAVKATRPEGLVMVCGNASSSELPLNVFPFILRGVKLAGVDSANCSLARRETVWRLLAGDWKLPALAEICTDIGLDDLDQAIGAILAGRVSGRVVVDLER